MFCIYEKLKLLQTYFKKLNTKEYSMISDRMHDAKFQLDNLQKVLGINPTNPAIQTKEKEVYKQYLTLARAEAKVSYPMA